MWKCLALGKKVTILKHHNYCLKYYCINLYFWGTKVHLKITVAKCLHSAFIRHALQLGLLLVQKTYKVFSRHISRAFYLQKKIYMCFYIFHYHYLVVFVLCLQNIALYQNNRNIGGKANLSKSYSINSYKQEWQLNGILCNYLVFHCILRSNNVYFLPT